MKLRIHSDIHAEFYRTESYTGLIAVGEDEENTTLILAGDICTVGGGKTMNPLYTELLDNLVSRFKYVILVTGNHDYYSSRIDKADRWFTEYAAENSNFYFLNGSSVKIDDVVFVGGSLWTNFGDFNPLYMQDAVLFMNDYKCITIKQGNHYRKLRAIDTYEIHKKHVAVIEDALYNSGEEKVVVVTHMLPSFACIDERYKTTQNHSINHAYASDLDDLIFEGEPDLWIYGHTHSSSDFMIGETRMIANPCGYPNHYGELENYKCDPLLVVEV